MVRFMRGLYDCGENPENTEPEEEETAPETTRAYPKGLLCCPSVHLH